jgi:hypothetical protein
VSGEVLLPPPARTPRPLPLWMAAPAVLGLVILATATVPAVLRHKHLASDQARLERQTEAQEAELLRLTRELEAAREDGFAREHALQVLLHPSHRTP